MDFCLLPVNSFPAAAKLSIFAAARCDVVMCGALTCGGVCCETGGGVCCGMVVV